MNITKAHNKRVNLTAGSSVALDAASSVAAAGYPWRYTHPPKTPQTIPKTVARLFLLNSYFFFLQHAIQQRRAGFFGIG